MKNKNNKNKKSTATVKPAGPGRPAKAIKWPATKQFTMDDMVKVNEGICSKLCIIQHLQRDAKLGKKSMIVKTDEKRDNSSGRGRKLEVYMKRAKVDGDVSITKVSRTVKVVDIAPVTTTEQYEAMKAELAAPSAPVAVADIPAVETVATPEVVAEVTPEPAPVAEVVETPVVAETVTVTA